MNDFHAQTDVKAQENLSKESNEVQAAIKKSEENLEILNKGLNGEIDVMLGPKATKMLE